MEVHREDDTITVEAARYRLTADLEQPLARLTDAAGERPMHLFLLAALDSDRGLDGTVSHGPLRVDDGDSDACVLRFPQTSTAWAEKEVRLRCDEDEVAFEVAVTGSGTLGTVRLLGGSYTGNPRWGGGTFHSQWSARTLFDPSPDDPRTIAVPTSEPATIGVVGNSLPGRGHWFFTPAPFLFAGHPTPRADPDAADGPWQTLELRCGIEASTFSELRYAPFLGGFSLELAYDGNTRVEDGFTTPPLVLRYGDRDPYAALERHAERLRAEGLAPVVRRERPDWWTRPIFCGWGEQVRQSKLDGGHPSAHSRRDLYNGWLDLLEARGIVPGTIVIDDKWQSSYGRNEPDPDRWPDLRGWIADRHARGQRVLLWFKAWDTEGLPADACVTDARGRPVAADPTSDVYRDLLREAMRGMLAADGLDADGLKVDFTAQTPSGPGLRRGGPEAGVALLHRLMELIYGEAKAAKPDALVVTHTASPLFADVTDMIRLNDLIRLEDPDPWAPAVIQMRHRARVAGSIEPGMLIDTDDWCMPSKAEWRAYLEVKAELGVPALYYATGIDRSGEAFNDEDYAAIADAWRRYEARRVQDDD